MMRGRLICAQPPEFGRVVGAVVDYTQQVVSQQRVLEEQRILHSAMDAVGEAFALYAKRLERGRFVWPSTTDGVVTITPGQLGYLLEGIDWRHPQHTWRPELAG